MKVQSSAGDNENDFNNCTVQFSKAASLHVTIITHYNCTAQVCCEQTEVTVRSRKMARDIVVKTILNTLN